MSARQRWPAGAEQYRQDAVSLAADARELLDEARRLIVDSQREAKRNPGLKEMMDWKACTLIAQAETALSDIHHFLEAAKNGK